MVNKIAVLLITFAIFSLPLFGLSLDRGKMRLVVNDKTGRFSLFMTHSLVNPNYLPLFVADDPTTSKWQLLVNGKMFVLGDSNSFRTEVEKTDTGAKVTWSSALLKVSLRMDFLSTDSVSDANGLELALNMVNTSTVSLSVAVRWLLDTNLGEKKDHFVLSDGTVINSERGLEPPFPAWWSSNSPTDDGLGLNIFTDVNSTSPAKIVFANWKRLDESVWDYMVKLGRDFSLLPYSFNDSPVLQYYPKQDLPANSSRTITVDMALRSVHSLENAKAVSSNPLAVLLKQNEDPGLNGTDQDLASLKLVIKQLDADLKDPSKINPADLLLLQGALDSIESRQKALETAKLKP